MIDYYFSIKVLLIYFIYFIFFNFITIFFFLIYILVVKNFNFFLASIQCLYAVHFHLYRFIFYFSFESCNFGVF